jgi:hypothetical protein
MRFQGAAPGFPGAASSVCGGGCRKGARMPRETTGTFFFAPLRLCVRKNFSHGGTEAQREAIRLCTFTLQTFSPSPFPPSHLRTFTLSHLGKGGIARWRRRFRCNGEARRQQAARSPRLVSSAASSLLRFPWVSGCGSPCHVFLFGSNRGGKKFSRRDAEAQREAICLCAFRSLRLCVT